MRLSGPIVAAGQDLFTSSATAAHALGEWVQTPDGRVFRYVKNNSSNATVAGDVQQAPAVVANHVALAVQAAAAIGATSVSVTTGATDVAANQYANGYLIVNTTPGEGYTYQIKSHPARTGAGTLALALYDPLIVALTTASRVDLIVNPYNGIIIAPTTLTGMPVGVAHNIIAVDEYGWIQTRGAASVSVEGTPAAGSLVAAGGDTAGQATAFTGVLPPIGVMMAAGVDEARKPVFLTLD